MKTTVSKISKLYGKGSLKAKKANKVTTASGSFKHEFRVLTAEDVNKERSSAYQYLAF